MKRAINLGLLLLVIASISGCIFSSDDSKEVKKGVVKGKVSMIITSDPLSKVKVMLVNMDVKVDTVNTGNNRKAFVDSALTNASGEYVIDNVAPGNYGVVAFFADTTATYKFNPEQKEGPYDFAMNGETRTVNFIAEQTNLPGAGSNVILINYALIRPSDYTILSVKVERREWVFFVPVWSDAGTVDFYPNAYYNAVAYYKGYTAVVYTLENYFRFTVSYFQNGQNAKKASFELNYPFNSTPDEATYTFDLVSNKLTRI